MFEKDFQLNEQTLALVEQIGRHMPGGFFIYQAQEPGELLFANQAVFDIFGCADLQEFKELTGYTFRGMVTEEDYPRASARIRQQAGGTDRSDLLEYRIRRRDGSLRWVDDYIHYTDTPAYGGIIYAFMSDITEKRTQMETDLAVRLAVIDALSGSYHTVWLINDVETG